MNTLAAHQSARSLLPRLLLRISLRYLLRHPWQFGLCMLGVALGVAVVVSIDLANASASRAFTLSTETIAGRATHQVLGGPSGLDDTLYARLRIDTGLREAAPVVEGYVRAPTLDDATLRLLGIDPFAEAPFRPELGGSSPIVTSAGEPVDLATLLVEPGSVLLTDDTAARYGLQTGDTLAVQVGGSQATLRLLGLIQVQDDLNRRALTNVLVADIATAQEALDAAGRLTRIDLIVPDDAATLDRLETALPPGAQLTQPAARSNALRQMTSAFELNLAALSLLALIVGVFLIYNTMTFSMVQRRELFGTLRCLGVTRGQIFALIMIEAAVMSVVGSLLGLLLGVLLAQGLVGLVTRTINDLYFVVTVRGLAIDPLVLLKGALLGVGATLAAAAVPAREAMAAEPRTVQRRSSIEEGVRRALPWATAGGIALLMLGVLTILAAEEGRWNLVQGTWMGSFAQLSIVSAFAALFMIVIGCALLTPGLTVLLMHLLRPLLGRVFGLLGRMAARDVVAALSRTSVAIAALMVAVSVTIGVGVMVDSFRQTVVDWLDQSLLADVYVSPPSNTANRIDTNLDPALVDTLADVPGVAGRVLLRDVQVELPTGPTTLIAVARDPNVQPALPDVKAGRPDAWAALEQGAVFISEPLAYRTGLGVGDTLTIPTDVGPQAFPIAAIYYDYTSDRGVIRMDYATYRAFWDDPLLSSFALFVQPGTDPDALVETLQARAPADQALVIASNRGIRETTLAIFDRTFAITTVLQLLATIVAFIGILSALMALQLERSRELAMLRANGLTPRQLWGLVLAHTSLMGLTAGVLALPVGLILALVLVFVINRRSFGWTLNLSIDPLLFGQALLVALLAALLAGIYPALRMSRVSPGLALREE